MAFSWRQVWDVMNARARRPKITNKAMMRPSLQAYFTPPHWMANSTQIIAGPIRRNPRGSNCLTFPSQLSAGLTGGGLLGVRKTRSTNDTAPIGTLIQKHQRHVTPVKYPPSNGPMMEANPKTEPMAPVYLGRDCRGTRMLTRKNAPDATPAPPAPVITRPTIKALDVGADAQTIEPTSKTDTRATSTHLAE